ncbi:MAG TPA: RcnB family protein [Herbaspirillum sp.]|nr:RcnB family protein [Herbaspirillum sp.]
MNKKSIIFLVLALTIGLSALPVAQAERYGRDDDRHSRQGRDDRRGPPGRYGERGRGVGPNHAFYRGDRLPLEYRGRQYVVENWREHHLSAPPRGYHWVQIGVDYVLVAITTGVILQLFLGN